MTPYFKRVRRMLVTKRRSADEGISRCTAEIPNEPGVVNNHHTMSSYLVIMKSFLNRYDPATAIAKSE